jgi:hypothetical protein
LKGEIEGVRAQLKLVEDHSMVLKNMSEQQQQTIANQQLQRAETIRFMMGKRD